MSPEEYFTNSPEWRAGFIGLVDDSGVIAPTIPEISRPAIPGLIRPPVPEISRPPIPELFRPPAMGA